ncbi:transmembrane sensor [Pedobacter africanus]|uniref:Ferric-dicitrate binding protein FerR (Iron transport regulator) n=1 Tax=Pedobacter africanus TaxID=151894 RepID=A0ACC6KXJ9_9SPHI|nr:FecR domain-containing protein [Pedobacter africanus]MDR6784002.1 ferric-dicitrate binding protein FerR (iron transport regulator) [Pedobacter africanus]
MKQNYLSEDLLYKYKTGTCTEEERAIVESWHIKELQQSSFMPDEAELDRAGKAIWAALPVHDEQPKSKTVSLWLKYGAAASVALILAIGGWYFFNPKPGAEKTESQASRYKNDVQPGGNKAVLTLADGSNISLDDAANGKVAQQQGIVISKTAEGKLIYSIAGQSKANTAAVQYNTIATPRGGQYQLNLPDGTKVWLNAATSLRFPSSFAGLTDRRVELAGEAYFEVAKSKAQPFVVKAASQEVLVLGTHFNVDAYSSGSTNKTTLMEGSIKLKYKTKDYLLKPGQQAVMATGVNIETADTEAVMAWKNGNFIFTDNNIKNVMEALQRWYDIEVVYEGTVSQVGFNAEISRERSLIQVLTALEKSGNIRFKIEGRRVTVM